MKRTFLIILSSLCGFMIVCCSKVDAFEQQPCSDTISKHFISEDSAISVATSFMEECIGQNLTKASGTVKEVFTIGENDAAYVINYEGGGFSIVASDDRMEPVLGYSETGHIDNNEDLFPEGLKLWIRKISAEKEYLNGNDIPQTEEMNALWNKYQGIAFTKSIQPNPDHELLDELVGPLLTDSWTQNPPFNRSVSPYPIGCVPLAIARVMHYHKKPDRFAWNNMSNSAPTAAFDSLIVDIHTNFLAEGWLFRYSNVSYTSQNTDYVDFFDTYYGYPYVHKEPYSPYNASNRLKIKEEILYDYRPVIIRGYAINSDFAHVWVCDGAHNYEVAVFNENTGETFIYGYLYFHHAWGENINYDCWLTYPDYSLNGSNFNQDMFFIYCITPYSL